ncbi:MAG: Phage integrase family, partial [Pseudomonadota bacterium]
MSSWLIDPSTPTIEMMARWLVATRNEVDETTLRLYELHCRTHLAPHFDTLDSITTAAIATYGRVRLGKVERATLQKERSTLRRFLGWCAEQHHVEAAPELPVLPARATGTPFSVRRRGRATELSVEDVRALIVALPVWSNPRNAPRFPVRARFIVAYETSLRPSTLSALSVPEHYTAGASTLKLTAEIDKARFAREVPLSAEAKAALESVAPTSGLIFGEHDYRDILEKAAAVLAPEKRATFTQYDLRHGRLTHLAETGNLTGAAYLAGHKRISTTDLYVRPGRRAAERALEAVGATGFALSPPKPTSASARLVGYPNPP